eukprot:gene10165-11205_t
MEGLPEDNNTKSESAKINKQRDITRTFARFMVKYPYVNIILVLILTIWAAVIGFVPELGARKLPDFAKPTKGFQPRDTKISNRADAYSALIKAVTAGQLTSQPSATANTKRRRRSINSLQTCSLDQSLSYWVDSNKIIYKHKSGGNLLTADRMKEICRLHHRVTLSNVFNILYYTTSNGKPCPSFGIAEYIFKYAGLTSCSQITTSSITNFMSLMKQCLPSYRNGGIRNCVKNSVSCYSLPAPCNSSSVANVVYNVFYYLTDAEFAQNPDFLKLALVSDNLKSPYDSETLYKNIYNSHLKDLSKATEGSVKVVAFDFFDLKYQTFNTQLFVEASLLSVAMVFVLIFIIIYSGSIFTGLMTFLCIIMAAIMGYFFYGIVFRLSFFPFLNILTLVFLVGIGADDAFVFMGAWKEAKRLMPRTSQKTLEESLTDWTTYSLKHAIVAMFVTSLTTAAAFYANATSKIIAIRCFGVYAGTCILLNYLLMVFWFPVVVITSEKYFSPCLTKISPKCFPGDRIVDEVGDPLPEHQGCIRKYWSGFTSRMTTFFEITLPKIISKLKFLFIFILTGLGIGGLIVLFVSPKLGLPTSKEFIMFSQKHPLEQYPLFYKSKFAFGTQASSWYLSIKVVFGVKSENTASMMDPDDKGKLQLKSSFSMSSKEEQIWLHSFCTQLENATFVRKSAYYATTCHSVLQLWKTLNLPCGSPSTPASVVAPCCNRTIPISRADFDVCHTNLSRLNPFSASGLLYDRDNKQRALYIRFQSIFPFSEAFEESKKLINAIDPWMTSQFKTAPSSFSDGWWTAELEFYDLQNSLATGTQISLAVSVAIAFGVVLFTTWNVLISLYSILCIIFVISVSIGILVLGGWRLNILESIVFSVAAGLSVDFTLHFGVAYRSAIDKTTRNSRVMYSLVHLGSAVTMGAITTFISGLVMAPATVLVYIQLSHFLMTLMTFSWLYATFFFLPLCSAIGPVNNTCQLSLDMCSSQRQSKEPTELELYENAALEGSKQEIVT